MAALDVLSVQLNRDFLPGLRGYSLDVPRAGMRYRPSAVEIKGWAVAGDQPLAGIVVDVAGGPTWRVPTGYWRIDTAEDFPYLPNAERSGFRAILDLSASGDEVALRIEARLADGSVVPMAAVRLRRTAAEIPPLDPPVQPGLPISASRQRLDVEVPAGEMPEADDAPQRLATPRCSIVIPVHNQWELTQGCLDALLAGDRANPSFEIVVVDDASSDETPALLASYGQRVRAVRLATNAGFATACNVGAAVARGDLLVMLNNDTVPTSGWLPALAGYADAHPQAGAVGAKLLYPDGSVQHAGVVFDRNRFPHHLYAGFPADHPAVNVSRRFRAVTAACMLVRRMAWVAAGGFDPAYVNGWEDVDFCLRLGEAGHEIHYCHESVVYHLESGSRDPASPRELANRDRWARRWREEVAQDDVAYYQDDGLLTTDPMGALYPIRLRYSPLLAITERSEGSGESAVRAARRIANLLRRNVELTRRVRTLQRRVAAGNGERPAATERDQAFARSPRRGRPRVVRPRRLPILPGDDVCFPEVVDHLARAIREPDRSGGELAKSGLIHREVV